MSQEFLGREALSYQSGPSAAVSLLDDCSGTFSWSLTATGGDDVHGYDTTAARFKTNGLHLKTRTTSAAAADYVQIQQDFDYPRTAYLTMRCRFRLARLTGTDEIDMIIDLQNATNLYRAKVGFGPNTPLCGVYGSDGQPVLFSALALVFAATQWVTFEMVIDVANKKYVSVALSGVKVDASAVSLQAVQASTLTAASAAIKIIAGASAPAEAYLTDLYVGDIAGS